MKTGAFLVGLGIGAVGLAGLIDPSLLYRVAGAFTSAAAWWTLAAVRVAVGVLLVLAAPVSKAPRAVRVVALVPILAGITIPIVGVERAGAMVAWWTALGPGMARLTVLPVLALGSFIAWAFAPG